MYLKHLYKQSYEKLSDQIVNLSVRYYVIRLKMVTILLTPIVLVSGNVSARIGR